MLAFFANLFGYLLNFIYNLIGNYGVAIILFSILVKILLLPISISQQKTMKKTAKIQDELKVIQVKNKTSQITSFIKLFSIFWNTYFLSCFL